MPRCFKAGRTAKEGAAASLQREREALLEKPEPRSAEDERRIDELRDKIREASVVDLGSFGSEFKRRNDRAPQATQSVSPFLGANGFLDYEQVSGDTFATGSTRIPNTWSTGFIHGADSLLPVTRLASRILRPDEVIRGLERVTWKKPMTSNLQIAVMRGPMGQDPSSVMSGSLQTTQGQLTFEARLIDEPLRGIKQESNP